MPHPEPALSLIIDMKATPYFPPALAKALFEAGNYRKAECLVIYNDNDVSGSLLRRLDSTAKDYKQIKLLPMKAALSCSERFNEAVGQANGKILGFLGKGVVPATPNWMADMVAHLCATGVGALGGRLLSKNGLVHSLGYVVTADGRLFSLFRGLYQQELSWFSWTHLCRTVQALDPRCIFTPKKTFDEAGGLNPDMAESGLIDYCLRISEKGLRQVVTPRINFVLAEECAAPWETEELVTCEVLTQKWSGRLRPCHPYLAAGKNGWTLHYNRQ